MTEVEEGLGCHQSSNHQTERDVGAVTLVACGDIGLYRELDQIISEKGPLAILGDTAKILKKADLVFGNLEGPVSDAGKRANLLPPHPSLRMHPRTIDFLKEGGFNIVSVANNHMLDYGYEALLDTIRRLEDENIRLFGAGKDSNEACAPRILNVNGIRFGFVGFHERGAAAKPTRPGCCKFSERKAHDLLARLKKQADIIVISLHFGFDYFACPSPYHIHVCRILIDKGADLILGHHPHVPQAVEEYKRGLIAYSLGNFVFHMGNSAPKTSKEGFMLRVTVSKIGIKNFEIIPYKLNANLSLSVLKGEECEKKVQEYEALSKKLQDPCKLRRQWYDSIRNFYSGYIVFYWNFDARTGNVRRFIRRVSKLFAFSNANRITMKSLIWFIISGYLIKAETKRLISKITRKSISR